MRPWVPLLAAASACAPGTPEDTDGSDHPLDDVLRFDDLQAKGTHNSYHVQTAALDAWAYTHAPLADQLGEQGVRQFELDLSYDEAAGWEVFHIPFVDEGTTCRELSRCLADLKGWSDDHRAHHPLLVLLEVKDDFDPATVQARLASLDAEVLAVWPETRLVTPDLVQADAASLSEALSTTGWPTLGALRGRAMFVLHAGGDWRDAYTDGGTTTAGRPLFPEGYGEPDDAVAAVHVVNDPWDPRIGVLVDRGHLVRTRCDSDTAEARAGDTSRRDQALASGAHFVSTDFPAPVDWSDYWVSIPAGTPSRCNPRSAPPECTSGAVESDVGAWPSP